MKGHFRLEQLQAEFDFTTDEELVKNRRYQAIQLREQEVPEFRGYKLLPALEREIQDSVFDVSTHVFVHYTRYKYSPHFLEFGKFKERCLRKQIIRGN